MRWVVIVSSLTLKTFLKVKLEGECKLDVKIILSEIGRPRSHVRDREKCVRDRGKSHPGSRKIIDPVSSRIEKFFHPGSSASSHDRPYYKMEHQP